MSKLVRLLVCAAFACAGGVDAAILTVNAAGTGEYPTIQAAVDAAADGDTVLCQPGAYTGVGNQAVELRGKAIAVIGEGGAATTILDCAGANRAFFVHEGEGAATLVQGFTIRDGFNDDYAAGAGGGVRVFQASPTLRNLVVEDCVSGSYGGGIYLYQSQAFLEDIELARNRCDERGGGVCCRESDVSLENALIHGNDGDVYGGGIDVMASTLAAAGVTVAGNDAGVGCGIFVGNGSDVTLTLSLIAANTGSGGGINRASSGSASLSCCDLYANAGGDYAGSMQDQTGTDGNISVNPWFCDAGAENYFVDATSPCLPANNACGALIGARGEGCALAHYTITGTILDGEGVPLAGVPLEGVPDSIPVTDALGRYELVLLEGWSGTLTPVNPAYAFDPPSRSYSDLSADHLADDYTGIHGGSVHAVPAEYATIQAAVDACLPGDSVLVAPGDYSGSGNVNIILPGFDVSIIGVGGSIETNLACANSARGFLIRGNESAGTLIQGFTVSDAKGIGTGTTAGGGVRVDGAAATLRDLRFTNAYTTTWGSGLYFNESEGSVVEDVVVEGGRARDFGGGVAVNRSSVSFRRLQVLANISDDDGGAAYLFDSQVDFVSCSFVANGCGGDAGGILLEGGETSLTNCLVAYNGQGIKGTVGAALAIQCSDVWGNLRGDYAGELADQTGSAGNLSVEPRFCDIGAGIWSLDAASPCLPANNACGVLMGALGAGCSTPLYHIAGRVADEAASGVPGVRIGGLAVPIATDPLGDYSCLLPAGWSGELAPLRDATTVHYILQPPARSYADLSEDLLAEDYLALHPTHVHVPADIAELTDAMDYALSGDTVTVAPGTYDGPLDFAGRDILLRSSGGPEVTTLESGSAYFIAGETEAAVLDGFTMVAGYAAYGGAVLCGNGATPTLRNLVIRDAWAWPCTQWGGPLAVEGGAAPRVSDCTFRDNSCLEGGALWLSGSVSPVFTDCVFEDNVGSTGGAAHVVEGATPRFERCVFRSNVATSWDQIDPPGGAHGHGGAVYVKDSAPEFVDCLFVGNRARDGYGNVHGHSGGALYLDGASPRLTRCTFSGNGSDDIDGNPTGGAIHSTQGSTALLEQVIVALSGEGGGILASDAESAPLLSCCDVYGNAGGDYLGMDDPTGADGNLSSDPFFCDPAAGDFTLATYSPCLPENNGCGLQIGAYGWGCEGVFTAVQEAPPVAFALDQNHPNPFNPKTTIRFALPRAAQVTLTVHDASGRRVASLLDAAQQPAGFHSLEWDAGDQASGVYFCRIRAGEFGATRKMVLIK